MATEQSELGWLSLAVYQREKPGSELFTLCPRLNPLYYLHEALPSLSEAAIHLCVGPTGGLADLSVGITCCEQCYCTLLLRLQLAHRLGTKLESLPLFDLI